MVGVFVDVGAFAVEALGEGLVRVGLDGQRGVDREDLEEEGQVGAEALEDYGAQSLGVGREPLEERAACAGEVIQK